MNGHKIQLKIHKISDNWEKRGQINQNTLLDWSLFILKIDILFRDIEVWKSLTNIRRKGGVGGEGQEEINQSIYRQICVTDGHRQ